MVYAANSEKYTRDRNKEIGMPVFAGEFIFSRSTARSRSVNIALQINIAPWNSGAIGTQRSPSGETKYFSMSERLIETSWYVDAGEISDLIRYSFYEIISFRERRENFLNNFLNKNH